MGVFYILFITQTVLGQNTLLDTPLKTNSISATNLKSLIITQIDFSKDSTTLGAFEINNQLFQLPAPLPLLTGEINLPKNIVQKIVQVTKSHDGWLIRVLMSNKGPDTTNIKNILPFEKNSQQAYITGKGEHRLSRTHLFLPGKLPVNVIVPDNAWELGFNTKLIKNNLSVFGFSRRNSETILKGKNKRFETILYPGGSIEYTIWIEPYLGPWQTGLLKVFKDRKLYDVEKFDDSLYKRKDLQWVRHTYLMHLMMAWDKFFYDRKSNQYALDKFIQRGNNLYGGDDIITIWPTWPTLGLDQRNQFDLYQDLPGGLSAIQNISNQLANQKKHLFVSYNPWDVDTRAQNHYNGLSWLIKNTNADGVVLDTQGSSSDSLQSAADSVRKGVVMYSEGMAVPKDMQGIISGRVHNALYYPPMLNLNKLIQPGFTIYRVAELYKEPINREFATSFFNGYGTEMNIMVPGQPAWTEKQYELLGKTTKLLRLLSDNFNAPNVTPLISTNEDRIWVNKWATDQKTVFTIYSTIPQGYKNDLFEVVPKYNWHFVDVLHHKLLKPTYKNGNYRIEAETDAFHQKYLGTNNEGAVDCIVHFPKIIATAIDQNNLQINLNKHPNLQNNKLHIEIWKTEVNWHEPALSIPFENQTISMETIFPGFEGKLIVQVIQKDTLEGTTILIDEDIIDIPISLPRLINQASTLNAQNIHSSLPISTNNMRFIPPGKFIFKQTHGDDFIPYPSNKDSTEIQMSAYWMDTYPVTNFNFYSFIQESNYKPSDSVNYLKHWEQGRPRPNDEKKPVIYISYEDALAYAHWYHKDLPTEKEWQYAAQTSQLNEWPWHQINPVTRTFEEVTNTLSVIKIAGIDTNLCNLGNGHLDTVGAYPLGINPNGLHDLVGSVWQLTSTAYASGSYAYQIMKGGSYFKPSGSWWYVQGGPRELSYAQYLLKVNQGFERNGTVGFRCILKSLK